MTFPRLFLAQESFIMVRAHVMAALDKNCWSEFPQWECYAANVAGLMSTALWFIVLFPQVIKNWYRKSVKGLSFLWAVANFTASLVNLFFAFSISLPLYVRVMAVYMPCLEFTILCQFMLYSQKPLSTRLLALLVCLLLWGTIIELELNLPQSREKIQWIAITLWSIETFPQVILNIKLQSTSGQSTISVIITVVGKTMDFLVTNGLEMPLEYVIMCYFSSSTAFINGFQVVWFGKESWFDKASSKATKQLTEEHSRDSVVGDDHQSLLESHKENTRLLVDAVSSSILNDPLHSDTTRDTNGDTSTKTFVTQQTTGTCRYWFITLVRLISIAYIVLGLIVFSMGLFWRTRSFLSLLGPLACLCIVLVASEYYHARRTGQCEQCRRNKYSQNQNHREYL